MKIILNKEETVTIRTGIYMDDKDDIYPYHEDIDAFEIACSFMPVIGKIMRHSYKKAITSIEPCHNEFFIEQNHIPDLTRHLRQYAWESVDEIMRHMGNPRYVKKTAQCVYDTVLDEYRYLPIPIMYWGL